MYIALQIVIFIILLVLLVSFICFYMAFFVSSKEKSRHSLLRIPKGEIYKPFEDRMLSWMRETREMPHEDFYIKSFDGKTLHAMYFEYEKGAPCEILFHGYRGCAEQDLCGGVQRCFKLGRSAMLVEQRASGKSQGHVITFGIKESRDVISWLEFYNSKFDTPVYLCGISMGASTVLMASRFNLPSNVKGIIADCGYSSIERIIKKTIREMGLSPKLMYPFVRLGAYLFGGFNIDETSPEKALKSCRVPVVLIHGTDDKYVPCKMSDENYNAIQTPRRILKVEGAGHGLAYIFAPEEYLNAVREMPTE